jgi:hypothetical protein
VEPPLRLSQLFYDPATGDLVRPPVDDVRAPESALVEHLAEARALLAAAPEWTSTDGAEGPWSLSAAFEHLRWFDLPRASLLSD